MNKTKMTKGTDLFPRPFFVLNVCLPTDVNLSAVAGNGKFAENTRHFLLHVAIRRCTGNRRRDGFGLWLFRSSGDCLFAIGILALGDLRLKKAFEIAGKVIGKFRLGVSGDDGRIFRLWRKGRWRILPRFQAG